MSLTAQLNGGDLHAWCARWLTGSRRVVDQVAAAAAGTHPIRPSGVVDVHHWSVVGGAFVQRLTFVMQHAPPYGALLGAYRAGLVEWSRAQSLAAAFPTHLGLDARCARATQLRPLPGGTWRELRRRPPVSGCTRAGGVRTAVVGEVVERLVGLLADHAPPGQLAASRGVEAQLARLCVVLKGWEDALYRTGLLSDREVALYGDRGLSVDALLATVPERQVAEIVALLARMRSSGTLETLRGRAGDCGTGIGIVAPVFVEQWAGGDVLLRGATPGGGTTLVDVKSAASVHDGGRVIRWLWHLLACSWLDPDDSYRIREVGLYLGRHGVFVSWPVEEFASTLLDGRDVDAAARSFRALAAPLIERELGLVRR